MSVEQGTGSWAAIRERMLESLPRRVAPGAGGGDGSEGPRPLAALTTRAPDDPTIALVDAVAGLCGVLSFYADRIAAEGYLPTAVQPRSLTEIADGLGYARSPGAAAEADLSFTVDATHPGPVTVPAGHAVLSVPTAPDTLPVTFETAEDLEARAEWTVLPAARSRPHAPRPGDRTLHLAGIAAGVVVGDALVLSGPASWLLHTVVAVVADPVAGRTEVGLDAGLSGAGAPPPGTPTVVTFAERARPFGATAPDARLMPAQAGAQITGNEWTNFPLPTGTVLDLDREYPAVTAGSLVVLQEGAAVSLHALAEAVPVGRADFALSGSVTRLRAADTELVTDTPPLSRRGLRILVGARAQALAAEEPDDSAVEGARIGLALVPETPLPVGRAVLVGGVPVDGGPHRVTRTRVAGADASTLWLADELPALRRDTVTVSANVVTATHGLTVADEVLGGGDAGADRQSFGLRRSPLTWVRTGDGGTEPELVIRVNGVRWTRVESLYGCGPHDRVYTLRPGHDGTTTAAFGDGRRGARPPTGTENVRATYRIGLGTEGLVPAGQLYLLRDRPPGLVGVTNPSPARGGTGPDDPDRLRRAGPRSLVSATRPVAVDDYAALAAVHPGVGKALATALWTGTRAVIHVTAAGVDGAALAADDPTRVSLAHRLALARGPGHEVLVGGHTPRRFTVTAALVTAPDADAAGVLDAARTALAAGFSFAERGFAQPVTLAEVIRCLQRVPGLDAVEVDDGGLVLVPVDDQGSRRPAARGVLPAAGPAWVDGVVTPAELLLVDAGGCDLSIAGVGA